MKRTFFFALLALGIIAGLELSQNAYADSPLKTTRYRDYILQQYPNDVYTQTLGVPEYVWNGSQFVDRIIANNGTHYNVYSEMGSFSFNKSTCTITQYAKGFDPTSQTAHDSDIIIKNWFWTIARKNGVNPWQVIDASTFSCNIVTSANSTGKYLTMTRTDLSSGSYLKVDLVASAGKQIEDFTTLFMNKTAWNGNKFAFVLWAKDVKVDYLTYRNGTGIPIPNGQTMIDKSQLTTTSMDFVKNGNPFYFDWAKAAPQFKTLILNKTGGVTDVQFGFNDNPATLNTGQKMHMDPTYGYVAAAYKSIDSNVGVSASCNLAPYVATGNKIQVYKNAAAVNADCQLSVPRWNTASIPDYATITQIDVRYDIDSVTNMGTETCNWNPLQFDPNTASTLTLWNDAQNGTTYLSETQCRTATNDKVITLGGSANSDLQALLPSDWFATGIVFQNMVRDASFHQTNAAGAGTAVELQVTYTVPPYQLKPMNYLNTTATTSGYVFQRNNTVSSTVTLNATGWAIFGNLDSFPYNLTVKDSIDQFVVNKTYNKVLISNVNKVALTNVFDITCGVGLDWQVKTNFTNYHNQTYPTNPTCAANEDINFVVRNVKSGLGPASNQTTKIIARSLDTVTYNYSPSAVYVNGSSKPFTWTNNVLNATGIQVGNGYTSTRLVVKIVTDNVTSVPTGLGVTQLNATSIKLDWTAPSANHGDAPNGYRIYRNGLTLVSNTTSTAVTYTDYTVVAGTRYDYTVCALNRIGCSHQSNTASNGPDPVLDLTIISVGTNLVELSWTQPNLNGGTLAGYQINYTTPWGAPLSVITNNTGTATTTYTITGLTQGTQYSFRVGAWTAIKLSAGGNIANTTTLSYGTAVATIGSISVNATNPNQVGILFSQSTINSTASSVFVTYPITYNLACDLAYQFAQTNQTYTNLTSTNLGNGKVRTTFLFNGTTNDMVNFLCWDQSGNDTGRYTLAQSDFLIKQQVRDFRNGTYGTMGFMGSLDLITIIVVIFAMIGFNRVNEAVGAIFMFASIGALAYFEIITWSGLVFSALAILAVLAVSSVRKD